MTAVFNSFSFYFNQSSSISTVTNAFSTNTTGEMLIKRREKRFSFGILQIPDSNETRFITQCVKAIALLIAIEANLIDEKFIDSIGGCLAIGFRLSCRTLFGERREALGEIHLNKSAIN
jgi:hypothetical protein